MADDPLRALSADLTAAGRQVGQRARQVIRKTAYDIEGDAKRMAPRDPARPPKDPSRKVTGNLRNSISHSDLRIGITGNLSVDIGPTAAYGEFLELGTSTMAARPFMGPAADRHTPSFEAAMQQLGAEAIGG